MSRQNTSQRAASTASSVKRSRGQNALANLDDNRQEFNHPPSSSHPSLPAPYSNGSAYERNGISEWATGQLEGPGMPVARNFVNSAAASVVPDVDTDAAAGDGDGDGDDGRTYCVCDRVSFGEMIACDDENCEKEWVSRRRLLAYTARADGHHNSFTSRASASLSRPKAHGCARRARRGAARSGLHVGASAGQVAAARVGATRRRDS